MNATRHLRFFVQLKRCSRKFRLDQSPSWSAPDPLIPDPIHPSKLPPIIHQIVVLENASQTFILWRVWYALVHGCLKCLKIQFLNGRFFRRLYIFNFHRPYTFADRSVKVNRPNTSSLGTVYFTYVQLISICVGYLTSAYICVYFKNTKNEKCCFEIHFRKFKT